MGAYITADGEDKLQEGGYCMSEESKTLFKRFVDEVFNKKNVAVIDELMDPNMVEHNLGTFPTCSRPLESGCNQGPIYL